MIFQNVKCPVWALAGLIANDYTGLTKEQVDDIDSFKATYDGLRMKCPGKTKKSFCLANTDCGNCTQIFVSEYNGISSNRFELCVLVSVVFE